MNSYALIVGISHFTDNLQGLSYAEPDAYGMMQVLSNNLQIPVSNIRILLDCTKNEIFEAVSEVKNLCTSGDRVIVYIATHGKTQYESPWIAASDASASDGAIDGWFRFNDIIQQFYSVGCSVLGFLDSCHSTMQPTRSCRLPSGMPPQVSADQDLYNIVFAAAGVNEKAHEDSEYAHGCWTYFLIDALQGNAPKAFCDNTSVITAESLQDYLYESVKDRVHTRFNDVQRPHMWGTRAQSVVIHDYTSQEKPSMKIKDMYFGEIDTDSEMASLPESSYLTENFYDLNSITEKVTSNNLLEIIVGNKGTGKTYIGEYLEKNNESIFYQSVSQITWNDVKTLSFAQSNQKGKYCVAWKYIMYVLLAFRLIKDQKSGADALENLLCQIYKDNYQVVQKNPIARKNILFRKEIKSSIRLEGYDAYAQDNGIIPIANLCMIFEDIFDNLTNVGNPIIFLLDGLDEQLRGNIQPEQKDIMLDLIGAMHTSNSSIDGVKFILLFRNDILQVLTSEANLNKTITARSHLLSWLPCTPQKEEAPLYCLLNKRICTSAANKGLEPMTLEKLLPTRMSEYDTWEWIMELTTYTPRDVIAFFNECKKVAGERCALAPETLWNATKEYSKYLWIEMKDILSSSCLSGMEEEIRILLEKLGRKTTRYGAFSHSDFLAEYRESPLLSQVSVDDVIKVLYESGIVAVCTNDGRMYWYYRENPIEYDHDTFSHSTFLIHKGLWKFLHIW